MRMHHATIILLVLLEYMGNVQFTYMRRVYYDTVCLANQHERIDRESNPHSDNIRTWIQCTRPLSYDTESNRIRQNMQLGLDWFGVVRDPEKKCTLPMTSILISSVIPTGNIAFLHRYRVKILEASLSTAVLGSTPFHELFLLWPGCSVEVTVGFVASISTTESDFALEWVLMLVSPVWIPSSSFSVLLLLFCLSLSGFWRSELGLGFGMFVSSVPGMQTWVSRACGRGSQAGFPGGGCSDRVPRAFVMDSLRSRDQDAVVKLSVASQNWTRWATFWDCMNWMKYGRAPLSWSTSGRVRHRRDLVSSSALTACLVPVPRSPYLLSSSLNSRFRLVSFPRLPFLCSPDWSFLIWAKAPPFGRLVPVSTGLLWVGYGGDLEVAVWGAPWPCEGWGVLAGDCLLSAWMK